MSTKETVHRLKKLKQLAPGLRNRDLRAVDEAISHLEKDLDERLEDDIQHAREEGIFIALKWLEVKKEDGRLDAPSLNIDSLEVDADHSIRGGLLGWMIKGNEPFKSPPPRYMSRPWHGVISEGEAKLSDMAVSYTEESAFTGHEQFSIGQYAWRVLDRDESRDPTVFTVTWQTNREDPQSIWHLHRTTYPGTKYLPEEDKTVEVEQDGWHLERVSEPDPRVYDPEDG